MFYSYVKRFFDVVLVLILLPLVLPVIFLFGTLFALTTFERPVYRQWRTGLGNRRFKLWKLRTMTEQRDSEGRLLPDEERITRLGYFMRTSSIDELPQLINILKGEMSFVGPRPQIDRFLEAMTVEERRRHDVRPGLTGYAQISGRNAMTWSERFVMDVWYVDNASILLDLQIMFQTPMVILSAKDTNHANHATMPCLFEERAFRSE